MSIFWKLTVNQRRWSYSELLQAIAEEQKNHRNGQ